VIDGRGSRERGRELKKGKARQLTFFENETKRTGQAHKQLLCELTKSVLCTVLTCTIVGEKVSCKFEGE